jgi:anti-sigma factor RsiW
VPERPSDAASAHRQAWEAIPWLVNDTATAAQRRLLEAHLSACDACRLELARQRELQSAIANAPLPAAGEVEAGLQRLYRRIDRAREDSQAAAAPAPRHQARRAMASGLTQWLAAAVVVEALALAVLGVGLVARSSEPAPGYVTLGDGAAGRAAATIRVVPAPSLRIDDLQRLLLTLNLQVVAGPNRVGAYDLAPRSEQPARELQIATLRADPGLRLVEPIDPPGAPR